jgi:hypothetical protein
MSAVVVWRTMAISICRVGCETLHHIAWQEHARQVCLTIVTE